VRLRAGLAIAGSALAHAPENAAYGLLAFAALGAGFAPIAMGLALLAVVVSNAVGSALGMGRLVVGQRAALALLTAALVAALVELLQRRGAVSATQVFALCALGVAGAGALQIAFGLLRLGNIVKYTPHPVRVGVTSGVGLLLIVTALPVVTGHGFGAGWRTAFDAPQFGAIAIALIAIGVNSVAARRNLHVPAVLVGLGVATVLQLLLVSALPDGSFGAPLGEPALSFTPWAGLDARALWAPGSVTAPLVLLIGAYSLTVAVLGSLDALLVVSVVDGRLRRHRDPNRELCAQGVATLIAGAAAAQAGSPSMPKSLAMVAEHPEARHAGLVYAAATLVLLVAAPKLIGLVPASAIGGVLLLQGVQMVAPSFWRAPLELWRLHGARRARDATDAERGPARRGDWAIELAVALGAVAFGLGPAVVIGASCAVLLFVRANMRDVVRREWTARTRRSLKARPSAVVEALSRAGARITLLELEGPLFFGTADGLRARLEQLQESADTVILDLHRVPEIDITAARILSETAEHWARLGRHLVFAEWRAADEAFGPGAVAGALRFVATTDLALEEAEERLLAALEATNPTHERLTLADTMLGRGLDPDELAWLAAQMDTLHIPRGQVLFRLGDPGDGFYLSLAGDIGLRLPGSARRLASFAPGVVIGEMATLTRGTRSAEAFAESDVTALKLSVDAFDRLMSERPVLAAKLLKSMSLHLADRVRTLTGDLSHWVARSAANRDDAAGPPDRSRTAPR
jgi:SulP family sulfate permease